MSEAFTVKTLRHGAMFESSKQNRARKKFLYNQTVLKLTPATSDHERFLGEMAGMVLAKTEDSVNNEVSLKRLENGGYLMVILESGEGVEPVTNTQSSKDSQPRYEVV